MIKIDKLNPFGRLCVTLGMLPSSYKESLTYEEQLLWMLNYIEKTLIPTINNNAQAVEELQTLYLELKSYVDSYFKNLDVQEQINKKLDEMAQDGTLAAIIEDYATIPELTTRITNAENEIDDLQLGISTIPELTTRITNAENEIDDLQLGIIKDEIIIVGDSYLAGQSLTNPSTENFGYLLMQKLSMTTNNFHIWAEGGSSFTNPGNQNHTWLQLVQSKINEVNPNKITKLIFAGGYNDIVATTPESIRTAMANTINTCKTLFPNAKIYVDLIGNSAATTSNGSTARNLLKNRIYNIYNKCSNYGAIFIDKGQLAIQNYSLYEDNETAVHPNAQGHIEIANWLYQCLKYGSIDYTISINPYNGNTPENFSGSVIFAERLINNKVELMFYTNDLVGTIASGEVNINLGQQPLKLIRYNAIATGYSSELGFIRIGNSNTNVYHTVPAIWYVDASNNLHLQFQNEYENINKIISNWNSFNFDVNKI